jgi:hypothetical protein
MNDYPLGQLYLRQVHCLLSLLATCEWHVDEMIFQALSACCAAHEVTYTCSCEANSRRSAARNCTAQAWLRVATGYHTAPQVLVGYVLGVIMALSWLRWGLQVCGKVIVTGNEMLRIVTHGPWMDYGSKHRSHRCTIKAMWLTFLVLLLCLGYVAPMVFFWPALCGAFMV